MLRCIAIDDEPLALELLEDNISKVPFLQLVAACSNPLEAINIIRDQKIDLVFLDIQMPGLTGLQLIKSMTIKPMFILVTAYEKYAVEGFNMDVIDYLVKPVTFERFIKAAQKAMEWHQVKTDYAEGRTTARDHFFISVDYSLLKVVYSDIMWMEGLKDYIKIHLKSSSRPVVARLSLKGMEEQLPASGFIRIHKSYIVSKDYITAIRKNCLFLGTVELPVSENYKDGLMHFINPGIR